MGDEESGTHREEEERGESGWGREAIREWPAAGVFIISHCKEARWDNWSLTLNTQHAFLMSPHLII